MRGSFKQIKKKKKECGALLCRTQPYFSLRLFGCLHYRALIFLFLTHISFSLFLLHVCVCTFEPTPDPYIQLVMLSFATVRSPFFWLSYSPFSSYLLLLSFTLTVSVYYSSNGKQRCHCGSILSAQRVADGRNLCRL